MKVDYLNCRLVRSGGTKIIAQHVKLLRERGHDARIVTTDRNGEDLWGVPVFKAKAYEQSLLGGSDILVGSWLRDVEEASRIRGPVICHLCQGYEPFELLRRIKGESVPPKYRREGTWGKLLFSRKKWSFRRRIRKIERIYRLPTTKLVVLDHLKKVVERFYGGNCHVVPGGIDTDLFRAPEEPRDFGEPLRIISIGPMDVVIKGIHDTFEAIRLLKEKNIPIEFIRVSLSSPTELEVRSGLVDRFLTALKETEMAELYRSGHILINPTRYGGIDLPALEAMSCGIPCILTDWENYRSLDPAMDFAYFVPPHSPETISQGVLKIKEDRPFREQIVKRGLEVAGRYSLENMGRILEETLMNLLTSRKGRP